MSTCNNALAWKGDCCCNCQNQQRVTKHPWNAEGMGKGSVSETFGWVCMAMSHEGVAVFFDRPHGMCEMHAPKAEA